jgi:predicted ribosomally synthesized peptide with SipW-like signal peptide
LLRHLATGALVVGAAAALLVGSATYAPFTDEATGSGRVTAGSVQVRMNGTDTATFDFDTEACGNMEPGTDCVVEVVVDSGTSTLSAVWDTQVTENGDEAMPGLPDGCFTESFAVPVGDHEDDDADDDHDPNDTHTSNLTVHVTDDNACQSAATDITVRIVATQSPSPQN